MKRVVNASVRSKEESIDFSADFSLLGCFPFQLNEASTNCVGDKNVKVIV